MRTPRITSTRRVLLSLIVVATAFATTASAHAAYLTLGTSNTSNAQTTLTGNSSGPELKVQNTNSAQPAIRAEATGVGGVSFGVFALLIATAPAVDLAAVRGQNNATNTRGYGVFGSQAGAGIGVYGYAPSGTGVSGATQTGRGVLGVSSSGNGVRAQSATGDALFGLNTAASPSTDGAAVRGDNGATNAHGYGVYGTQSGSGIGVYGWTPGGTGVRGQSPTGTGVLGSHTASTGTAPGVSASTNSTAADAYALAATVTPTTAGLNSEAVRGVNNDTGSNGIGVFGYQNGYGKGVFGASPHGVGVYAESASGRAIWGLSSSGDGVRGQTTGGTGVIGASSSGTGVSGSAQYHGVYGHASADSPGSTGVEGQATGSGIGVRGFSSSLIGQLGDGYHGAGVFGGGTIGVYGQHSSLQTPGWAGYFEGDVEIFGDVNIVNGVCTGCGGASLHIDDPLDPAHKYLQHSSVESPDMLDVYSGTITTGIKGFATVTMPAYFQALNRSFRYQLTVIGKAHWDATAAVWDEVKANRFTIRTDEPNVRVSWQVTGVRHDPYANAHRVKVVEEKPAAARGKYLHPELYGKPHSLSEAALPLTSARRR